MTSYIDDAIICGASVIGRSHIENGTDNQDFFKIKKWRHGTVLCVCDGVGSDKYSRFGARAAAKAVVKAAILYKKKKLDKASLGAKIEELYRHYTRRKYRTAAGTTCLFCMLFEDSEIIIGQAGDGVILIKQDERFLVFQAKTDDFLNEVNALSCVGAPALWKIRTLRFHAEENKRLVLIMATDGISEDIIPDKREVFLEHFAVLCEKGRNRRLSQELKNWAAPGSVDDKTAITFLWSRQYGFDRKG